MSKSKEGLAGLGAFSLLWGSAFGTTAHAAVHDAAHGAFMTLPQYPLTKEGEVKSLTFEGQTCHFVGHLPVE